MVWQGPGSEREDGLGGNRVWEGIGFGLYEQRLPRGFNAFWRVESGGIPHA
jgi:hypothetical protein